MQTCDDSIHGHWNSRLLDRLPLMCTDALSCKFRTSEFQDVKSECKGCFTRIACMARMDREGAVGGELELAHSDQAEAARTAHHHYL
jgi:hypothetical protein